jgi:lipid-A-disaccharide synthase-like uncharacterized protein
MWKRYLPLAFWITGLLVVVVRLVYHMQSDASAWRFVFDALIIVLFTSNSIEALQKLKQTKLKMGTAWTFEKVFGF